MKIVLNAEIKKKNTCVIYDEIANKTISKKQSSSRITM